MTSSTTSKARRGRTNTGYKYVTRLAPGGRSAHRAERIMAHADQAGTGSARTFNIDAYGVEAATRLAVEHVGVEPFLGLRAAGASSPTAAFRTIERRPAPKLLPLDELFAAGSTTTRRRPLPRTSAASSSLRIPYTTYEGWGEDFLRALPEVAAVRHTGEIDGEGTDYVVTLHSGRVIGVEVKGGKQNLDALTRNQVVRALRHSPDFWVLWVRSATDIVLERDPYGAVLAELRAMWAEGA